MSRLRKDILVNKNTKLGDGVWAFNLPSRKTCLYVSAVCQLVCYACKGYFRMANVKKSHRRNFRLAKTKGFVRRISLQITRKKIERVRLHASGDFFSPEYGESWLEIVKQHPNVKFWAYTKAWMIPEMQKILLQLADQHNFQMWFSTDQSMPEPPKLDNIKVAYLSIDDKDYPDYPVDLIFRDNPKTVRRRMGVLRLKVCPTEDGVTRKTKTTCTTCGFCLPKGKTNACDPQLSGETSDERWRKELPLLQNSYTEPAGVLSSTA